MDDNLPSVKRRKVLNVGDMHDVEMSEAPTEVVMVTWPAGQLPVEIFGAIADWLPRKDVQSLRLVCREFDQKISHRYFRNVVLSFRPEILCCTDPRADAGAGKTVPKAATYVGQGDNVFKTFGGSIRAFAFALELNEEDLYRPPNKLPQKLEVAPWGVYRWPVDEYPRFTKLEGIEDSADETRRIKEALSKLVNLKELGLSCDAGYGFLGGDDHRPDRKHRVFESSRYEPDPIPEPSQESLFTSAKFLRYRQLKQMALQAGFRQEQLEHVIKMLLDCEGKTSQWAEKPNSKTFDEEFQLKQAQEAVANLTNNLDGMSENDAGALGVYLQPRAVHRSFARVQVPEYADDCAEGLTRSSLRPQGLVPSGLTEPQRELLQEMMWAQEALIQSFVIAMIDCKDIFCNVTSFTIARIPGSLVHLLQHHDFWASFTSLRKLSLAVIPDWRVLSKVSDSELKDTAVSPVTSTYQTVFQLLNEYVAVLRHLDSLHFEWICGGELARGLAQRNRWLLPAPLAVNTDALICAHTGRVSRTLLSIPFIRRLSLKNCWVTPHVFLRVVSDMTVYNLTELHLETVSMTGSPTTQSYRSILKVGEAANWPWPECVETRGVDPGSLLDMGGPEVDPTPDIGEPEPSSIPDVPDIDESMLIAVPYLGTLNSVADDDDNNMFLTHDHGQLDDPQEAVDEDEPSESDESDEPQQLDSPQSAIPCPELFSWTHILNELTPGATIQDTHRAYAVDQDDENYSRLAKRTASYIGPRRSPTRNRLRTLVFKHCGYALVDLPGLDNAWIARYHDPRRRYLVPRICDALRSLDKTNMTGCTDRRLAKVVDVVRPEEREALTRLFDVLQMDCLAQVWGRRAVREMRLDQFLRWGAGRFSGGWVDGEGKALEELFPPAPPGDDDDDDDDDNKKPTP